MKRNKTLAGGTLAVISNIVSSIYFAVMSVFVYEILALVFALSETSNEENVVGKLTFVLIMFFMLLFFAISIACIVLNSICIASANVNKFEKRRKLIISTTVLNLILALGLIILTLTALINGLKNNGSYETSNLFMVIMAIISVINIISSILYIVDLKTKAKIEPETADVNPQQEETIDK